MDTKPVCKDCGAPLAADAPEGLCPACLMKVALGTQAGSAPASQPADPRPLPDPAKLAALFPQLEILELLGRGGMGAVYKARQPALDRFVALKILPQGTGNDPGFAGRFNREARTLARLNHPNIVAVYDFGQAQGLNYFIMEYVDGANLRQIQRAQKLSTREALQIIPQICEALQFAHDEGVVHRDIKPENVLLDKKGRVKIADFGLAKILGLEPRDLTLTGAKDVMGTPHYMAPEQVEHPLEVDHRADIYSLGVVFYELLTGELPLGKFAAPSKKVQVDVRLDEIVLHTLEKEPSLRYQNVSEVKTDVETVVKSGGGGERPHSAKDPLLKAALPDRFRDAWRQVKGPAIGLVITGILAWISIPLILLFASVVFHKFDRHLGRALFVLAPVELVLGGILFVAGLKLKRLEAYTLAVFATVGAILVVPANLIGLPVATWALVVLTNREVRAAFAARARGEISSAPVEPPAPGSGALKVVGVILAAIVLFLAIPVGAILLAIAVPSFTRARDLAQQRQRVQAEREDLRSKLGLDDNSTGPDLLKHWLSDENIDPDKVDKATAPNLQVVIEDVQPDGTSGFRNLNREIVQGDSALQQVEFRNSDLVEVMDAYDADGNSIAFNSTHHDGQFHYTLYLSQSVQPGLALTYGTDGIMRNKLNEGPDGTFSYDLTHWPSGNVATRRVEVHRLPTGAELLQVSTNATSRVRNGRTEVLLDQIVPVDGSVALSYRYRLTPENSSPPTR